MGEEKSLLTCSCPGCENQYYLDDVPYLGLYDADVDKRYTVHQLTKDGAPISICPECWQKVLYGVTIGITSGHLICVDMTPEEIAACLSEEDPT